MIEYIIFRDDIAKNITKLKIKICKYKDTKSLMHKLSIGYTQALNETLDMHQRLLTYIMCLWLRDARNDVNPNRMNPDAPIM